MIHSHQYTNWQQLRRNFDLGVSQADHPEVYVEYEIGMGENSAITRGRCAEKIEYGDCGGERAGFSSSGRDAGGLIRGKRGFGGFDALSGN